MASLSLARPQQTPTAFSWNVLIDCRGLIQTLEGCWPAVDGWVSTGASYYGFLSTICGESRDLAIAAGTGIRAVAEGKADNFSLEFTCHLPHGETRIRLAANSYSEGESRGALLAHTSAVEGSDAPADKADKMETLGRMTGGVVHDFANLVTLVAGYSDILLNRADPDDPARQELEEIRKAAARGAAMTSQILDFVRNDAAPAKPADLNVLVAQTAQLLRPAIGEHIRLVTSLQPGLGLVSVDAEQMTRVIMNLVLNARDAMPRGGRIAIRTATDPRPDASHQLPPGRYVTLEISDDGCGMDPETLRRLFQPFFTTKQQRGTGVGLSTVHDIVKQAGGGIWVRSEPGQGSTFTISLPRAEQSRDAGVGHSLPVASGAGDETILIAEDEESVRRLLHHLLATNGYTVLEAADGSDALRVFEQQSSTIDLLLTDVVMPNMNGLELARKALALKAGLKVIYMSGYTEDVLLSTGEFGPGISFLRKPLKLDRLSSLIRELLDIAPVN